MRDQLGADFVTQLHQTGQCGIGYFAVDKNWTWNVLAPSCGPLVMAHEMGHNMGLDHSRRQGDTSGTRYRYGLGYGVDNLFATVMAYPSAFSAARLGIFSNPNLLCKGVPCGIPEGQDQEAYAAKAIHNVRNELAGFRATATVNNDPIKIFQDCSYGGYSASIGIGTYNVSQLLALGVKNDDISSIQVPSGYKVTLYADDNFAGSSVILTGDDACLVAKGFNDTASSIRVEAASSAFSLTVQAENYASNNGVQLQATADTGGWQNWTTITQMVTINAGTYNFGIYAIAGGWNINWIRIRK